MNEFDRVKQRCEKEGNTPKAASLRAVIKERPDGWYIESEDNADGPHASLELALAVFQRSDLKEEELS